MIETKDEAINHLKNGKDFSLKIFDNFRDDKKVALAAVSQYGWALRHCSERLRDDKEVALTTECKQATMEQSKPKARMKI